MTYLIDYIPLALSSEWIAFLRDHREWIYAFSFATGFIGVVLSAVRLYNFYLKKTKTEESIEEIRDRLIENEHQQELLRRQLQDAEKRLSDELTRYRESEKQNEPGQNQTNQTNIALNSETDQDTDSNAKDTGSKQTKLKKIIPAVSAVIIPVVGILIKHFYKSK